jgi:hypothetical protein
MTEKTNASDPVAAARPSSDEVVALTPRWAVKTATATLGASGALAAVAALQLMIAVTFSSPLLKLIPAAHLALGAASIFAGLKTYELRRWAAVAGVAVSALLAIGAGAWLVFALSHGIVSLIGATVPFAAIGGAVFAGLAIGPCARAERARARMFEGMERLY